MRKKVLFIGSCSAHQRALSYIDDIDIHFLPLQQQPRFNRKQADLLNYLNKIRQQAGVANNKISIFFSIVAMPMSKKKELVKNHNVSIKPMCEKIITLCDSAISKLNELIAK